MNNYMRHKLFLVYLQSCQKSCSFRKRKLYFDYAVSQVNLREKKRNQPSLVRIFFILQKFLLLLLPILLLAKNETVLLTEVTATSTIQILAYFLVYLLANLLQAVKSCCLRIIRILYHRHDDLQINHKERRRLQKSSSRFFSTLQKICILLLPVAVIANKEEILLNEVATKSSSPSFIELRKVSENPFVDLSKYGIVIAEKMTTRGTKNKGQLKVRFVLKLRGSFKAFPNHEIIHYGNIQNLPSILDPPPNSHWRVFEAYNGNDWLDIGNKNFLAIFLTKSDKDVMDVIKLPDSSRSPHVYIVNEVKVYLQESVVDFLVVRNGNGPSDDEIVNEIIEQKSPRIERMPLALHEFVTQLTDDPPTSLSRCGDFKPFDLRGFMNAKRTPREVNSCDDYQPKFVAEDHLPKANLINIESESCNDILDEEDVDMMPVEECNEDHETKNDENSDCEMSSLATGLDEQQCNKEIKENIDVTNEEVCVTEAVLSQRQAELELEIDRIVQLKRKLKNDAQYNDMEWTIGHPDFDIWIPQIQTYQSTILPLDLILRIR